MLHVVPAGALAVPASADLIKSALMFDGSNDRLQLKFNEAGNTAKWTLSVWAKRAETSDASVIIEARADGNNTGTLYFNTTDIHWQDYDDGVATPAWRLNSDNMFRDTTAWMHIVLVNDTENSTAGDRQRIYVNGTRVTSFSTETNSSQGYESAQGINSTNPHYIGFDGNAEDYSGYLAEFIFLDGVATTDAGSFGANDGNGVWGPKDPSDTDNIADWGGKNSFWLKFDDGDNIGKNSRPTAVTANSGTYKIDKSVWLDGGADYLVRDPSSSGNRRTFTFSCWLKRSAVSGQGGTTGNNIFGGDRTGSYSDRLMFGTADDGNDYLEASFHDGSSGTCKTSALYRDPTAWMHVLWVVDTTQATASNRVKIYVNGVEAALNSPTYPAQNYDTNINYTENQAIGVRAGTLTQQHFGGYLANVILLDGKAVTDASDFGGWDTNGNWMPVDPTTTVSSHKGTNGFWLNFSDSSDIGKDVSGNTDHQRVTTTGGTWTQASGFSQFDESKFDNGGYNDARCFTINGTGNRFTYDHGSGNSLALSQVGMANDNAMANSSAAKWKVEYSDNGSDWTDTSQFCDYTDGGENSTDPQYATITGQSAHRYWAWEVTVDRTAGGSHGVYEVELYEQGASYWTPTSIASTQVVEDSPTNTAGDNEGNYATWNSVDKDSNVTLSEGNTVAEQDSNSSFKNVLATQVVPSSGKWVWEIKQSGGSPFAGYATTGVASTDVSRSIGRSGSGAITFDYQTSSNKIRKFGGGTTEADYATSVSMSSGEAFQFAIDSDAEELKIFVNNTQEGSTLDISSLTKPYKIISQIASGGTVDHTLVANSADFENNVPAGGYKTLNTANLAEPTVTDPRAHFATALYTGTAQSKTVRSCFDSTGTAWTPDFVWVKSRSETGEHVLVDSVRGAANVLTPDDNPAEFHDIKAVTSLIESGFTLGAGDDRNDSNDNGETYVAWCMKAGGAASSNSDGNVTGGSTVSVASHNGFAIVKYGDCGGAAKTIGHGMGKAPDMIMVKAISGGSAGSRNWRVYHKDLTSDYVLYLDLNDAQASEAASFGTIGTSTFGVDGGSGTSASGESHIAYCFARTPGLIGIGSYTGNNSTDGSYVVVDDGSSGFRPAWVMIKNLAAGNWFIYDAARNSHNVVNEYLLADSTAAAATSGPVQCDFTANGFKLRSTNDGTNNGTYVYLAFADQPFNLARAR
jgi:hypothetical protein